MADRQKITSLSAQPSPGGQDALAEAILRMADHYAKQAEVSRRTVNEAAWLSQIAHELRIIAARQPVGEAIGEIVYSDEGGLQIEFYDGKPLAPMKLYAAPPAQAVDLGTGIKAIASERERQLCIEGFSRDSDEQYREGELARAATAYVQLAAMDLQVGSRKHIASQEPPFFWPWAQEWWKPVDARRDLVRAGALIAAQIDLIDSQAVGNG